MSGSSNRENYKNFKNSRIYKGDFWSVYKKEDLNAISKNISPVDEKSNYTILPQIGETVIKNFNDINSNNKGLKTLSHKNEKLDKNNASEIMKKKKNGMSISNRELLNGKNVISKNLSNNSITDSDITLKDRKLLINENNYRNPNFFKRKEENPNELIDSNFNTTLENYFTKDDDKKKPYESNSHKEKQITNYDDIKISEKDLLDSNDALNIEEGEEETQHLIEFMSNLDYSKYVRDLHIREALHLIKNKIEKENELEIRQKDFSDYSNETIDKSIISVQDNINKADFKQDSFNEKCISNRFVPEKDWDNSIRLNTTDVSKNKQEQAKTEIAEMILKSDKNFKNIHSIQSVKKLLERDGITGILKINPLRISILKERANIKDYQHISTMLPNLRDLPLI